MCPTPINCFYALSKAFSNAFKYGMGSPRCVLYNNKHLLREYYNSNAKDWHRYILENQAGYAKHWVMPDFSADFAIAVLTWLPGQETAIHGHAENGCLMIPMTGRLEESRYVTRHNLLIPKAKTALVIGQTEYINDNLGLHSIKNIGFGRAVSIHIYSPAPECLNKAC